MLSGLAGTVMQGMAFGTGSAVAHRAVDAIAGPRTMNVEHHGNEAEESQDNQNSFAPAQSQVCGDEMGQFNQCLKENPGEFNQCQFYYDVLSQCQMNSKPNNFA